MEVLSGVVVYDIKKDAVIVRLEIPCGNNTAGSVEKAVSEALIEIFATIQRHIKFPAK